MLNAVNNHLQRRCASRVRGARAGFTIIELLVVVAVIIILASILITAMNLATQTAQSANTTALMSSISQSLATFRDDVGYLPPVLGAEPGAVGAPQDLRNLWLPNAYMDPDSARYPEDVQEWKSYTTLADYLIGYGPDEEDGYGTEPTALAAEYPMTGIRHPGDDGVWNATLDGNGSLADRDPIPVAEGGPAGVYGPYLELDNPRLLASTDGTFSTVEINGQTQRRLNVYYPGDDNYDPDDPRVIVDYWGEPIQYFRKYYPGTDPGVRYRTYAIEQHQPTLADVFILRPFDFEQGAGTEVEPDFADRLGDISVSHDQKGAEFGLFSPGADQTYDETVRHDESEYNKDNVVELGQ